MRKYIAIVFALFGSLSIAAQSFEGEIIYHNSFKSKITGISDEQLSSMIGSVQDYYIRGGEYKSIMNGTTVEWQLYVHAENKLYSKPPNSQKLSSQDGSMNPDEVISSELHKSVLSVLGYTCDELILTCRSGIQKYYFSSKIAADSKLYVNHKYGNWWAYLSKTNALPLKMIIETAQFNIESVATEIKPMKLNEQFFHLPR